MTIQRGVSVSRSHRKEMGRAISQAKARKCFRRSATQAETNIYLEWFLGKRHETTGRQRRDPQILKSSSWVHFTNLSGLKFVHNLHLKDIHHSTSCLANYFEMVWGFWGSLATHVVGKDHPGVQIGLAISTVGCWSSSVIMFSSGYVVTIPCRRFCVFITLIIFHQLNTYTM